MLLYYIRHGDPIYDPDSLTPLGERQEEALAKRIANYGIDQIYASTSNRAYRTAFLLAELTKKNPADRALKRNPCCGILLFSYGGWHGSVDVLR